MVSNNGAKLVKKELPEKELFCAILAENDSFR